jgi:hypothetical protein
LQQGRDDALLADLGYGPRRMFESPNDSHGANSISAGDSRIWLFCIPFELVDAFRDDRIATLCLRYALQPIDDQLTSLDESSATGPASLHFGMGLVHELHCSKRCT